ncbi:MAG: MFS transporter [Nanoarchaeota archaeon]|nr:MFS transporter [Nanoarchaeota archaeon]
MPIRDILHGLSLHKLKPKKEITEVYISITLRYLAFSMINLFVPLYLYNKLGYTLNQTLLFYIVFSIGFGLLTIVAGKLISRIGVKHTILLSVPFYLAFYLLLYSLESFAINIYFIALFFSCAQAFFWTGFHTEFIVSSDHEHRSKAVSKYISLSYLAILIGPLIGGFTIDRFGFAPLFIIVSIFFFLSALFLFFTKDFRQPSKIQFKNIFSKTNLRYAITFFAHGAQTMAEGVLWPLFVFVILKSYTNLGLLGSAMSAVIALFTYLVGRYSNTHDLRQILQIGGIAYSLSLAVRTLASSIGFVFGITIFGGFSHTFVKVPLEAMAYNKAEKNIIEMIVFREIAINTGRIAVLLVLLASGKFLYGFLFSGLAGLGYLFF